MLQVFQSPEGQIIRIVEKDGEPWFVAKDVCGYFGDTNYRRSVGRLDDDERMLFPLTDALGRTQDASYVNESGLYSLLFGFQPQKAPGDGVSHAAPHVEERVSRLRAFKRWVTHDVLPVIRKTGGYQVNQAKQLSRKDLALMVVAAEEQIEALTLRVQQLDEYAQEAEVYIEEAEPAVAFQALVQGADEGSLGSLELSAFLRIPNRTMLAKMRAAGIIMLSGFVPTTDHRKRFESRVNVYENPRTGKESTSVTWLFKTSETPWLSQRLTSVTALPAPLRRP